jgi:hypothetical protein
MQRWGGRLLRLKKLWMQNPGSGCFPDEETSTMWDRMDYVIRKVRKPRKCNSLVWESSLKEWQYQSYIFKEYFTLLRINFTGVRVDNEVTKSGVIFWQNFHAQNLAIWPVLPHVTTYWSCIKPVSQVHHTVFCDFSLYNIW